MPVDLVRQHAQAEITGHLHDALGEVRALVERSIERSWYHGVQLYVAAGDDVLADCAGTSPLGSPFTPASLVPVLCAGKPLTAVALAAAGDGHIDLDLRVADVVPEVGELPAGDALRVRHLLSHTAGIRTDRAGTSPTPPWDELLARALADLGDAVPGPAPRAYVVAAAWVVLGEMIRRLTGDADVARTIERLVCRPLEMRESALQIDEDAFAGHVATGRIAPGMVRTPDGIAPIADHLEAGAGIAAGDHGAPVTDGLHGPAGPPLPDLLRLNAFDDPVETQHCSPGISLVCPAHDLGRFYDGVRAGLDGRGPLAELRPGLDVLVGPPGTSHDPASALERPLGFGFVRDGSAAAIGYAWDTTTVRGHPGWVRALGLIDLSADATVVVTTDTVDANGVLAHARLWRLARAALAGVARVATRQGAT